METLTDALPATQRAVAAMDDTGRSADAEVAALAHRLATGSLRALDDLWELCGSELYNQALWRCRSAEDAEDAVQDVFVRLARDPNRLAGARRPRAYLMRMVHNVAVDLIRKRPAGVPLQGEAETAVFEVDPEAEADAARAAALLLRLPAAQREVVYLRHFADLRFRDIGAATGVSTFTAASRYRLAVRRLRKLMGVE